MKVTISYFGQIRDAAQLSREVTDCDEGTTVSTLLRRLAESKGEPFRSLILDEDGGPRSSLLLSLNDEQLRDPENRILPEDGDLLVMTAISGG